VGPRAGLDDMDKRKFLTLPGLELQSVGHPDHRHSLYQLCYHSSKWLQDPRKINGDNLKNVKPSGISGIKTRNISKTNSMSFQQTAGTRTTYRRTDKSHNSLILFGTRKDRLISQMILLLYQFTRSAIKLTVVIIMGYQCYQLHTKF
jgi:hypothetical protein